MDGWMDGQNDTCIIKLKYLLHFFIIFIDAIYPVFLICTIIIFKC